MHATMKRSTSRQKGAAPLLQQIGQRVRALRQQRGLTLHALADEAGLSDRFVSDLEGGRANISVLNLAEVADALGVSLPELLQESNGASRSQIVALLGLRGAGKTTVGRALAERLGTQFYELDRLIEAEAGASLAGIFALHGEDYYRQVELQALRKFLSSHHEGVLATGGGLVTSPEAFRLLAEGALTVWLRATPEEHWERVVKQGDLRPMANRPHAMAELRRRLKEREPLYSQAQVTCSTTGKSVSDVAELVARRVALQHADRTGARRE